MVAGDLYLLRLSRQIHLNPVRTREAKTWPLEQQRQWLWAYRWRSYRGYIDGSRAGELVEYGPVLTLVAQSSKAQREQYREYVESGLAETDQELEDLLRDSPRSVGDREFRRWVDTVRGAAVSLQLKHLRATLEADSSSKKRLARLEKRILKMT